ncbi:MAG: 3-deoxy-D-manno-octulosonate 8-phosphate phosphatase KdsC [candidate division BRC1 bacterium ADurb.BinA364]|nr:MAG: 3-deoxy-D-manno-octulosonate 8-phosphate phosphatase KdsC [candidate division BRC1 bacterium ADurb.BinA364]
MRSAMRWLAGFASAEGASGDWEPAILRVRALVLDVDGVLTDSGLGMDGESEFKLFSARDGQGIKYFMRAGHAVAILTGRESGAVLARARDLGILHVAQGAKIKMPALKSLAAEMGVGLDEICYIGDDMPDLPCIRAAGMGVAVADAAEPLLREADCVCRRKGGQGAVRETVEWILKSQGRWQALMERYYEDDDALE